MNFQDRIAEFVLSIFDWIMNLISFGAWSRWQGARLAGFKVKER